MKENERETKMEEMVGEKISFIFFTIFVIIYDFDATY